MAIPKFTNTPTPLGLVEKIHNIIDELSSLLIGISTHKHDGTDSVKLSYTDLNNKPAYASVATSGSYADLNNKPTFAPIALSGEYNDLENIPDFGNLALMDVFWHALTLSVSGWSGQQQTVSVPGMKPHPNAHPIFGPAQTIANREAYFDSDVYLVSQGTNTLTFGYAETTPYTDISVNVLFFV